MKRKRLNLAIIAALTGMFFLTGGVLAADDRSIGEPGRTD